MTAKDLSISEQKQLISLATASVRSYVFTSFRGFFSNDDLDDIVGETVYKACQSYNRFDPTVAKLTTWIGRIAINTVISTAKAKTRRANISYPIHTINCDGEYMDLIEILESPDPYTESDRKTDIDDFVRSVNEIKHTLLNDEERGLLSKIEDGYLPRYIARELGITPNAVSVRKNRIRAKLRTPIRELALEFDVHNNKLSC